MPITLYFHAQSRTNVLCNIFNVIFVKFHFYWFWLAQTVYPKIFWYVWEILVNNFNFRFQRNCNYFLSKLIVFYQIDFTFFGSTRQKVIFHYRLELLFWVSVGYFYVIFFFFFGKAQILRFNLFFYFHANGLLSNTQTCFKEF